MAAPGGEVTKVALGLDVRADQAFREVQEVLEKLKQNGYVFEILFMEANDRTLLKRYKETRRMHPLSLDGRIEDGIYKEREILNDIREKADYVIDTNESADQRVKKKS